MNKIDVDKLTLVTTIKEKVAILRGYLSFRNVTLLSCGSALLGGLTAQRLFSFVNLAGIQVYYDGLAFKDIRFDWTKLTSIATVPFGLYGMYHAIESFIKDGVDARIDALMKLTIDGCNVTEGVTRILGAFASFGLLAASPLIALSGNIAWGIGSGIDLLLSSKQWYENKKFANFMEDFLNKKIRKSDLIAALENGKTLSKLITSNNLRKPEIEGSLIKKQSHLTTFKRVRWLVKTMAQHDPYQVTKYFGVNAPVLLEQIDKVWKKASGDFYNYADKKKPHKLPWSDEFMISETIEEINHLQLPKNSKDAKAIEKHLKNIKMLHQKYIESGHDGLVRAMKSERKEIKKIITPYFYTNIAKSKNTYYINKKDIIPTPKITLRDIAKLDLKETKEMKIFNKAVKQRVKNNIYTSAMSFFSNIMSIGTLICLSACPPAGIALGTFYSAALIVKFIINYKFSQYFKQGIGLYEPPPKEQVLEKKLTDNSL